MSDGFAYIDILFFAMVAAFIAYRLRSVLGRRTGLERQPPQRRERDAAVATVDKGAESDNVVALPDRNGRPPEPGVARQKAEEDSVSPSAASDRTAVIRAVDPAFDPASFLPGAKAAFGMTVAAYARGDLATLQPLLAEQVFANFKTAIEQRDAAGERLETEISAEPRAEIVDGAVLGRMAQVTVRFVSQQINVTRDAHGAVLSGDPVRPEEVVDLWTFERDIRSSDPNWLLAETATPQ